MTMNGQTRQQMLACLYNGARTRTRTHIPLDFSLTVNQYCYDRELQAREVKQNTNFQRKGIFAPAAEDEYVYWYS